MTDITTATDSDVIPTRDELLDALERLMLAANRESERHSSQLSNALENAMLVLESSKCFDNGLRDSDIRSILAARGQIAVIWGTEDLKQVRPDLTDDQAWEVLQAVEDAHDCNYGITWNHLERAANNLFPEGETAR